LNRQDHKEDQQIGKDIELTWKVSDSSFLILDFLCVLGGLKKDSNQPSLYIFREEYIADQVPAGLFGQHFFRQDEQD